MGGGLLLLAIVIFGISVMFGKNKPEQFYKVVILLIFAPVLLTVGFNQAVWFWLNSPLWAQILSSCLLPFFLAALLKAFLPKAVWLQKIQTLVFEMLIFAFTFPFRFLWRAGKFIFQRERQTIRLNPYSAVIGKRPPLVNQRAGRENQTNLFE